MPRFPSMVSTDCFLHGTWGALVSGIPTAGAVTGPLGFLHIMGTVAQRDPRDD